MLVELTVSWAYTTTPPNPFPVRVYWRLKGTTSYSLQNVANGTTTTITTINNSAATLDTPCDLEYEGYVIPECFVGTATDCDPYLSDGITPNPACTTSDRSYWNDTVDATNEQTCRGVTVSCESCGVYAIHAVDPELMFAQTYTIDGFPIIEISDEGTGIGFSAIARLDAYDDFTCQIIKDCWTITQGSGYTTTPTIKIAASDDGIEIPMIVTMACNDFDYEDCKSGEQTSGQVLLGESKTVCMQEFKYSSFTPTADNSVFEKSLAGCCSGNGEKFTLTFTSPDPVAFPSVVYTYLGATPGGGAQVEATLYHGVPVVVSNCTVIGSLTAYTPSPEVACQTDTETNIWLFNNHVAISSITSC